MTKKASNIVGNIEVIIYINIALIMTYDYYINILKKHQKLS